MCVVVAKWVGQGSVSVWVKDGKAWSLRSDTKSKNSDLAVVFVCVYLGFSL